MRERGEIQEWLQFFLQAVSTQAVDAVTRAEDLVDLREEFRSRLRGKRSRATEVIDLLFGNPVMTVRIVVDRLGVTHRERPCSCASSSRQRSWTSPVPDQADLAALLDGGWAGTVE